MLRYIAAASLVAVGSSQAIATPFNDLPSFLAASGDVQLVDFDTLPDGSPTVVGELGSVYDEYGLEFPPGNFITDTILVTISPPRTWDSDMRIGQDILFEVNMTQAGIRAAGVHNVRFGSFPNGATLRAFDASGAEIESVDSDADFETLDFFGVVTDVDIARVTITVDNPMGWGLDDLYVGVGEPCRADFDGDGSLTIFDFLAFQNAFDARDPRADFDGDGAFTIFDFLAFQNEFAAGC